MAWHLLQKVEILNSAEEHSELHGEIGVIIQLSQLPSQNLPFISILLKNNAVVDDLLPSDIQPVIE